MRREPDVPEARVAVVGCLDIPASCKDYLSGTCTNSFCEKMAPSRALVLQFREWMQIKRKVLFRIARLEISLAKKVSKNYTRSGLRIFKIWSRRSLHRFCGRARTYRNRSDVFNAPQPSYVMLTFETKILRLE